MSAATLGRGARTQRYAEGRARKSAPGWMARVWAVLVAVGELRARARMARGIWR